MYEYRQVIVRMRLGESDRAIAQTGLMGRKKVKTVRDLANSRGWLEPGNALPDDAELAASFSSTALRPQATSLVEPYADQVKAWRNQGIQGTTIHQALERKVVSIFMRTFFLRGWSRHSVRLPSRQPLYPFHPGVSYQYICASPTLWLRHGVAWQRPTSEPNGHRGRRQRPWSDAWLP